MARIVGSPGGFRTGDVMTRVEDSDGIRRDVFARIPVDAWERLCEAGRDRVTSLGETEVADDADVLVWGQDECLADARQMSAGNLADMIAPCVDDLEAHDAECLRRLDEEAEDVRAGRPLFYLDGASHGMDDVRYALFFDRGKYWDGSTYVSALVDWGKCEPGADCDDWLECHGVESFADVTVNLGHTAAGGDRVFLDENNFRGIKDFLVENGLAEDMNLLASSGFCVDTYPLVRLTDKMMEASTSVVTPEHEQAKEAPSFDGKGVADDGPVRHYGDEDIPF